MRLAAVGGLALAIVGVTVAALISSGGHGSVPVPTTALPSPIAALGKTYTLKPVHEGPLTGWRLPVALSGPRGIAISSDGRVWVAEQNATAVDVIDGAKLTRYSVNPGGVSGAFDVARGPADSMWFTGYPSGAIGRVFPDGHLNVFNSAGNALLGVAKGPAESLWVTDFQGGVIAVISPDGKVSRFTVTPPAGAAHVSPRAIVQGIDHNMWFTDPAADAVGRITTGSAPVVTEYRVGDRSQPRSIAAAPNGSLWVTLPSERALAKIDPSTGGSVIVAVPAATEDLNAILVAPDGSIWVTGTGPWIYHLRSNGSLVTRYRLPAGARYADELAIDARGTIWTTAADANLVVAIAPG